MTTQQTPTLATFLLAQIAADETVALKALADCAHPGYEDRLEVGAPWYCDEQSSHVAVAPAHALATCAAHRAIVEESAVWEAAALAVNGGGDYEAGCADGLTLALRALGTIYADREGFDPAWVAS